MSAAVGTVPSGSRFDVNAGAFELLWIHLEIWLAKKDSIK